jgi:ligand-binding sensor domain-containing protein/two-component sensor histidine kinase
MYFCVFLFTYILRKIVVVKKTSQLFLRFIAILAKPHSRYLMTFLFLLLQFTSISQKVGAAYTLFSVEKGVADNMINDIISDEKEIIWLASKKGISRFDNFSFINFSSKTDSLFFKDDNVDELYKANGLIYLISYRYGLIQLNPIDFKLSKVVNDGLISMAVSGNKSVFLLSNGKLQYRVNNQLVSENYVGPTEKGTVVFYNNKIYLKTLTSDLLEVNPGNLKILRKLKVEQMKQSSKLYVSSVYGLIYHSGNKVYVIDKNLNIQLHPLLAHLSNVTYYNEDKNGKVIYIHNNKRPYYQSKNVFIALVFERSLNASVKNILRNNDNCTFVGTNQGLIKIVKKFEVSSVLADNSFFHEDYLRLRTSMVKENDSVFYFLGFPGILKYKNDKLEVFSSDEVQSNAGVILNSKIYCATEGNGLVSYSLKSNKREQIVTSHILKNDFYDHISLLNDSQIILGGFQKIIIYNPLKNTSFSFPLNIGSMVSKIIRDEQSGYLWVASNKGLSCFKLSTNHQSLSSVYYKQPFAKKTNDFIIIPEKKQLWLATDDGLFVRDLQTLKSIKVYDNLVDISNLKVNTLFFNDNKVFASTNAGITVVDLENNEVNVISKSLGLTNTEYSKRSAIKLSTDKVIFGGLNSYDIVEVNSLDSVKCESDFFISAVELSGQKDIDKYTINFEKSDGDFLFKTGEEDLNLFLANNDAINSWNYVFEYQLNDDNWISLENKRVIRLSNLPPGNYTLNIRMVNPLGQISKTKTYHVNAFIKLYKQPFMIVLRWLLLFILIIVIIFFYLRAAEIENETKSRIAMDLHDEAGTILTRLSLMIQSKKQLDTERELVKSGLNEALYSLRVFIDSMSRQKFDLVNLQDEVREFLFNSFSNTHIKCNIEFENDKNYPLSSELYRDIKLCVYEVVNNSIKYSKCNLFFIEIKSEKKMLYLDLKDDGYFTNLDKLSGKGNGIKNIKKRVKRNNGQCLFNINNNVSGLAIQIKIPIK